MLILYQAIVLLVLLLMKDPLLRLLKQDIKKSPKSIGSFFSHLKRWDQSCRLLQYGLIFVSGYLQSAAFYIQDHASLMMVGKARQIGALSSIMSSNRKLIRLARLPGVFRDVQNWYQLAKLQKTNSSFRLFVLIQIAMGFLSDFFNLLYYFTDHCTLMYLFGIFSDNQFEYQADYWGNIFWIVSNVFLAIRDILLINRLKSQKEQSKKNLVFFAKFDFLRNILDTVIAFTYIDQGFLSKKSVGIMGVTSSVIMLADFWK